MAGLIQSNMDEQKLKMPKAATPGATTVQPSAAPGGTTAPGIPAGQPLPVAPVNVTTMQNGAQVTSQTTPMMPGTAPIAGQQVTGEGSAQEAADNVTRKNIEGLPTFATFEADQREVDAGRDTIQGQVNSILDQNGPLMQRAAALARQQMARRGLINSSMAIGASQDAVLDRAASIGAEDAKAYREARLANQAAENESRQFGAGEENKFRGMQFDDQLQRGRLAMQQEFDLGKDEKRFAHEKDMQSSDQTFKAGESRAERDWTSVEKQLDRGLTKEESALERGLKRELTMADITSREKITDKELASRADLAMKEIGSREKMGFAEIESAKERLGMELSSRKDLSQAEIQASMDRLGMELESRATLQASEQDFRATESERQREFDRVTQLTDQEFKTELANLGHTQELEKLNLGQEFDMAKIEKAQDFEIARMDKATQDDLFKMREANSMDLDKMVKAGDIDLAQKEKLMTLSNQYDLEKAKTLSALDTDQKKMLMEIEAEFQKGLRADDRAATLMQQYMANVGNIMTAENIPAEQKLTMANSQFELMKDVVTRQGKISNTDYSDLFPAAPPAATPAVEPPTTAPTSPAAPATPAPIIQPYLQGQDSG